MSFGVPPCPACHEVYAAKASNCKGFVYWCLVVSSHDGRPAVTFNHGVVGSSRQRYQGPRAKKPVSRAGFALCTRRAHWRRHMYIPATDDIGLVVLIISECRGVYCRSTQKSASKARQREPAGSDFRATWLARQSIAPARARSSRTRGGSGELSDPGQPLGLIRVFVGACSQRTARYRRRRSSLPSSSSNASLFEVAAPAMMRHPEKMREAVRLVRSSIARRGWKRSRSCCSRLLPRDAAARVAEFTAAQRGTVALSRSHSALHARLGCEIHPPGRLNFGGCT